MRVSSLLGEGDRVALGLDRPLRVRALAEGHRFYLAWHAEHVFKP